MANIHVCDKITTGFKIQVYIVMFSLLILFKCNPVNFYESYEWLAPSKQHTYLSYIIPFAISKPHLLYTL